MNKHLTRRGRTAMLPPAVAHSTAWCGNQFCTGVKAPLFAVVFLCPSFIRVALRRVLFVMAGLFGQASAWPLPVRGITTPFKPVPHAYDRHEGGYSLSFQE